MLGAILGGLGSLFSGGAGGAANNRINQNDAISRNNAAQANLFGINQAAFSNALNSEEAGKMNRGQLDLQQKNFALGAPGVRARQGLSADMLANFQPASYGGNLSPRIAASMPTGQGPQLSGQGQLLARLVRDNAISGQQAGDKFAPIPETNFKSGILTPPALQQPKEAGKLESILGILGMLANGGQVFAPMFPGGGASGQTRGPFPPLEGEDV
jgi:hypothetical protein